MELQTYFETTLKITLLYFDLTMLNSLHNKYKSEYYIKAKLQILDSLLGIKVSTTFRGIFIIFEVMAPVPCLLLLLNVKISCLLKCLSLIDS